MATQYTAGLAQGQVLTADIMNQIGAVTETFTPTWTSSGTAPALGNGTLSGRYFRLQKLVFVQTLLIAGSTTTYGTGTYRFALPVTARAGLYGFMSQGVGRVWDFSTSTAYDVHASFEGGATTYINAYYSARGVTVSTFVGATAPITFAANDEIQLTFWYEAA